MAHPEHGTGRHLRDYFLVLRERIWVVLTCLVLVVGAGALFTFLQVPVYRAEAKVELQVQAPNPLGEINEGSQPSRSAFFKESYFQTQFEIIRSRDLLLATIENHGLDSMAPFSVSEDPAALLGAMLRLEIVPTTDVISIAAEYSDPEVCASVSNAVATTYVEWNVERRVETLTKTMDSLRESLRKEAEALGATQPGGDTRASLSEDTLKEMESDLRGLDTELRRTQGALSEARLAKDRPGVSISLSGIKSDSISEMLKKRAELRRDFKDNHPDIIAATDQIIAALEGHEATLKAQKQNLNDALAKERAMHRRLRGGEIQIETRTGLIEKLSERLDEVTVLATQNLLVNQAQIIESARAPLAPVRPKVLMNMLVACVLGLFVSFGAAFFLDYLDVSIKTVEDVEKGLGQNVLATIPVDRKKTRPLIQESIQSLRTALIFADKAKPTTTVLFTSATPKEGKSSTVARLARALAAGGARTILLDCDFRLPTMSHHFSVSRDKGLATYALDEESSWGEHIHKDVEPGLDLFTTGPLPPNPTDLLVSPRLTTLFDLLSREYDWVLVDAPPVTSMSDAVLLSDKVDGIVFVIRYDHTDQRTVERAIGSLESVGARILGCVLNAVDTRKPGYRDYFYGRYAYYGEARKNAEKEQRALKSVSGGRG